MSRGVAEMLGRGRDDAETDRDPDTDPDGRVAPRVERRHARLARALEVAGGGEVDGDARPARRGRGYRSMGRAMPLRFGITLVAMLYPFAAHLAGLNDALTVTVLGLAAAFLGVDTIRPSGMVRE